MSRVHRTRDIFGLARAPSSCGVQQPGRATRPRATADTRSSLGRQRRLSAANRLMGEKLPKLAELLEQIRSEMADVAQSRARVHESMTALAQAQAKLGQQAETARRIGRADLAQAALARQEAARSQLAALALQYDQMRAEEAHLEARLTTAAQALQAKIDALSPLSE